MSTAFLVAFGCGSDPQAREPKRSSVLSPTAAQAGAGASATPAPFASGANPPATPDSRMTAGGSSLNTNTVPPAQPPAMPPSSQPGALPPTPPPGSNTAGPAAPPVSTGGKEPVIPAKQGECPKLATGNVTVLGQTVRLWVGDRQEGKKGPVFFYWHGTGSSSSEASLLGGALTEIQKEGGLVASFSGTTKMGRNTGNNVWYTGDFAMADQILACAVEQLNIDTRRVYAGGCSAGGLQAGAMLYDRSSYMAAVMTNSGGVVFPGKLQEAGHTPALITAHGKMGVDVVVIDFSTTSAAQTKDVVAKKGFAVNCDHGGRHCGAPADLVAAQWQFLKAHPFGVSPEPYAGGLPAGFPSYCTIVK